MSVDKIENMESCKTFFTSVHLFKDFTEFF